MVLEMRPAHDPTKTYGFVGVVVSLTDLSASIWLCIDRTGVADQKSHRYSGGTGRRSIAAGTEGFSGGSPLVTDIALSVDDRFLYALVGDGRDAAYDVSDPFNPKLTGSSILADCSSSGASQTS